MSLEHECTQKTKKEQKFPKKKCLAKCFSRFIGYEIHQIFTNDKQKYLNSNYN